MVKEQLANNVLEKLVEFLDLEQKLNELIPFDYLSEQQEELHIKMYEVERDFWKAAETYHEAIKNDN